jgi:hypothetical protein
MGRLCAVESPLLACALLGDAATAEDRSSAAQESNSMQHIMKLKRERKQELLAHPFFQWARDRGGLPGDKLLIAPIMAVFVMNFRDANKWFIRFPRPRNVFEEVINGNTLEDETHSRLFLEDWRKLRLDDKLGWRASDALWWLFLAPDTEPFRRFVMSFARMTVVDGGDPMIRFAHSEAGEACGNAFFSVLAEVTQEHEAQTGVEHRYFGPFHLRREPGHVLESPGLFEVQTLDDEQRGLAALLANEMFDIFVEMHDCFLSYARRYVDNRAFPRRPAPRPLPPADAGAAAEQAAEASASPSLYHDDVRRVLLDRKERTAAHPFFAWLRDEQGISDKHKLMRFIPMWIGDVMGYRELNRYAIRYAAAETPGETAINAWCDDLETHNVLFLNDWSALEMDRVLGWSASDTFRFCFLDRDVDVHRRNMCAFVKLALKHSAPALRYWLLEALEGSGHAFFDNMKRLARPIEEAEGIRLDYLGDRHEVLHPNGGSRAARTAAITAARLTAADRDVAIGMVDTVFDAVDEQLAVSLEVARTNKLGIS